MYGMQLEAHSIYEIVWNIKERRAKGDRLSSLVIPAYRYRALRVLWCAYFGPSTLIGGKLAAPSSLFNAEIF